MAYNSDSVVNGDYGSDSNNETNMSSVFEANLQGEDLTRTHGMPIQQFFDPLSYSTPVYTTQIDYVHYVPAMDRLNGASWKKEVEKVFCEHVYKHPEATIIPEKEINPDDSVSQFRSKYI